MRYRAKPSVCNTCPVKSTCTTSDHGREISREIDPWPHSEAGQFHRGIACVDSGAGAGDGAGDDARRTQRVRRLVLVGDRIGGGGCGHAAGASPVGQPGECARSLPHRSGRQEMAAVAADRFSTRWGGGWTERKDSQVTGIVVVARRCRGARVIALAVLSCKVLREYERGVVFRLGRVRPLYGPGLRILIPLVDRMIRVDQRVVTLTIPPQEVITRDNVPARVNAVVMFQVTDPVKAIMGVENYAVATSQIAQTTLRSLLGRADLDTLLAHREGLNDDLRSIIEKQTEPWGVEVRVVEIKDVEIPESMQRAMAREAEAERERRAKVINARGELQASDELRQAAETLSKTPCVTSVALSADTARAGRRPELHRRVPAAGRHHHPVPTGTRYPGDHRRDAQRRRREAPGEPARLTPASRAIPRLSLHRERARSTQEKRRVGVQTRTLATRGV